MIHLRLQKISLMLNLAQLNFIISIQIAPYVTRTADSDIKLHTNIK